MFYILHDLGGPTVALLKDDSRIRIQQKVSLQILHVIAENLKIQLLNE